MYTSESGFIHDPGSHDPDPGPQEKSMKKSCVSFETECILLLCKCSITATQLIVVDVHIQQHAILELGSMTGSLTLLEILRN